MSVQVEGAELSEPAGDTTPAPGAHAGDKQVLSHRTGGTIRRRVIRTLALPVATTLVLLTIVAVGEVANYREASATARAVTINVAVQELVQDLQTERGLTAGYLGGNEGFKDELAPARDAVDLGGDQVAVSVRAIAHSAQFTYPRRGELGRKWAAQSSGHPARSPRAHSVGDFPYCFRNAAEKWATLRKPTA